MKTWAVAAPGLAQSRMNRPIRMVSGPEPRASEAGHLGFTPDPRPPLRPSPRQRLALYPNRRELPGVVVGEGELLLDEAVLQERLLHGHERLRVDLAVDGQQRAGDLAGHGRELRVEGAEADNLHVPVRVPAFL